MKIACLLRSLELGGLERQMSGLATFLKKEGHDVTVVKYLPDDFYEDYVREHNIPVVQLKRGGGNIGMAIKIARFIKENEIDLLISFGASPNIKACLAKKIYGNFKLIVSERNFNTKWLPTDYIRFIAYKEADAIVSNSISQGQLIKEKFNGHIMKFVAEKSSTIINFTEISRFTPAPEKRETQEPLKILSLGRVVKRKNVHGYISAAKVLKDKGYHFNIEWYGLTHESSYYKKCMQSIINCGLEDMFKIYPSRKDVENLYRQADIFCLPSFYEGTSNAISEALSCGLPIICSAVSDNSINVNEGHNGWLFKPTDQDSIVSSFERMLNSSVSERIEYGKNSREIAVSRLSIERFTTQYKDLIESLAD